VTAAEREAEQARERCAALIRAGEALSDRPMGEIHAVLAAACARWLDPADSARHEGERALSLHHAVPETAIGRILDAGFAAWSERALLQRVAVELGDSRALDDFVELGGARRIAKGPRLGMALASLGVPTTPIGDAIDMLSIKAPVWLKLASGSDDLAARFARTLGEIDSGIGAAIHVSTLPADAPGTVAALHAADLIVATGRNETVARLSALVGGGARLVLHGPRLSAALLTRKALAADSGGCVEALAEDVAFAGQAGCLSPVAAWVEDGDGEHLLDAVHRACVERWPAPPRVEGDPGEWAAWAEWAAFADIERASGAIGRWVGGPESGWSIQWRVLAEAPAPPPAPRILALSPVSRSAEAVELCARARGTVATVGIAGTDAEIERLARPLALAGVERITPLGRMQRPPADWRRDGRPSIADLVRWVDREG
jgi:hypothetical protein